MGHGGHYKLKQESTTFLLWNMKHQPEKGCVHGCGPDISHTQNLQTTYPHWSLIHHWGGISLLKLSRLWRCKLNYLNQMIYHYHIIYAMFLLFILNYIIKVALIYYLIKLRVHTLQICRCSVLLTSTLWIIHQMLQNIVRGLGVLDSWFFLVVGLA